jgi:hypothetical protein
MWYYLMEKTPAGYEDRMLTGRRYSDKAEAERVLAARFPDGTGYAGYPVVIEHR